ncbi:MFS transporter [Streptomyces sp. NPDC057697]|uniref:MFS transporter n=1 Tax=Streptomyces sp. NPDC057697 TaxID=3346219 RepID=UPI0036CE583A
MNVTLRAPEPAAVAADRPAASRRLWAQRNFVLFWVGQTVSKVGNGAYSVALGWTVYRLTSSTAAMGLILALNFAPQVVFSVAGGTLADRWSRRSVIIAADCTAALAIGALAALAAARHLSLGLLMAAAVVLGTVSAFYSPAYAAMNRELLEEKEFRKANSVFTASGSLARLAGPLLAAGVFSVGGPALVFALNAASFAIAAIAMVATKIRARPSTRTKDGLRTELAEGLRYTYSEPWLILIIVLSLAVNILCLAPYSVLLPALVQQAHSGVGTLGLVSASEIAALLLASLVIGLLRGIRAGTGLIALGSAMGLGATVLGTLGDQPGMLFLGAILFGVGLSFDVIENTLLQNRVPEHLLSRVYSVNMTLSYSLQPLGYFFAGLLARHSSASAVLTVGGFTMLTACGIAVLLPTTRRLDSVRC